MRPSAAAILVVVAAILIALARHEVAKAGSVKVVLGVRNRGHILR